jgi:hypothetical protein
MGQWGAAAFGSRWQLADHGNEELPRHSVHSVDSAAYLHDAGPAREIDASSEISKADPSQTTAR